MDELAIGFPMGTSGLPIPSTIAAIEIQTFVVTYVGIVAGKRLGESFGRRTSRIASFVAGITFGLLGIYLIGQRFVSSFPEI